MVLLALARSIFLTPASATQLWYCSWASSAWRKQENARNWVRCSSAIAFNWTSPANYSRLWVLFCKIYPLQSFLLQPPLLLQLFVDCIGLLLQGAVGRRLRFLVLFSPLCVQRSRFTQGCFCLLLPKPQIKQQSRVWLKYADWQQCFNGWIVDKSAHNCVNRQELKVNPQRAHSLCLKAILHTIFFCSFCHCSLTSFLNLSSSFLRARRG